MTGGPGLAVVTGGGGFIGRHLVARLLADGSEVLVIDDFSSAPPSNLDGLDDHGRLRVLEHDVTEPWPDRVHRGVDRIYHLACPASPRAYQRDAVRTTRTAVLGALTVLEVARRTKARVLLSSTSEIYGDPLVHPQVEDYRGNVDPTGPRACYDEGKRCAETLFTDYRRQYGVATRIARIFNTYGPFMQPDDGRVVSTFVWQALHGRPLPVFGDGTQTRSFCFVDDLVDGLVRMMAAASLPGPVNLGNPEEVTIGALAARVIAEVGSGAVVHRALPVDDPTCRRPDITRARTLLGWEPQVMLAAGLAHTVAHLRGVQAAHSRPGDRSPLAPPTLATGPATPGTVRRTISADSALPAARSAGEQLESRGEALPVGAAEGGES